jgi:putative membrane protein
MKACQNDVFMAKAPEPGAPLKGANSFTESQAKDRAMAAGLTSVSSFNKDGDGIWRGNAMKDGKAVKVAVDFKGNVVSE